MVAPTAVNGHEDKLQITVGMPLLHSVRVQRIADVLSTPEIDKQVRRTKTICFGNRWMIDYRVDIHQPYQIVVMDLLRHHLYDIELLQLQVCLSNEISYLISMFEYNLVVKFDKSADSIAVPNQLADGEDDQSQVSVTTTDGAARLSDATVPKKQKQPVSISLCKTLCMKIKFPFYREIQPMI
jgi:hypothetical protein